jgi:hypothetical protein
MGCIRHRLTVGPGADHWICLCESHNDLDKGSSEEIWGWETLRIDNSRRRLPSFSSRLGNDPWWDDVWKERSDCWFQKGGLGLGQSLLTLCSISPLSLSRALSPLFLPLLCLVIPAFKSSLTVTSKAQVNPPFLLGRQRGIVLLPYFKIRQRRLCLFAGVSHICSEEASFPGLRNSLTDS